MLINRQVLRHFTAYVIDETNSFKMFYSHESKKPLHLALGR